MKRNVTTTISDIAIGTEGHLDKVEVLLKKAKPDIPSFLKEVQKVDFESLIDYGAAIDLEMKVQSKILDQIKVIMKSKAKGSEETTFITKAGCKAIVSDKIERTINPTDFVKKLKELGKQKNFDAFFSVKLGEAIKFLGEESLKDIINIDTKEAYACKFKK